MKKERSKLTGVYLKKFQSIDNPIFINLEHLTLFYGPNSAGKSSIIDAIEIIKNIVDERNREFNIHYLMRNSRIGDSMTSLGVEIKIGQLNTEYDEQIKKWSEYPDVSGDYNHLKFMQKIHGHKMQVEFSDDGHGLKIAIDGDPLFEISSSTTYYNDYHRPHDFEYSYNVEDEIPIFGILKLYKNSKWFDLVNYNAEDLYGANSKHRKIRHQHSRHFEAYHYELFVQETDDLLIINGINYELHDFIGGKMVHLFSEVSNILFLDFNNIDSTGKIYSTKAKKFLKTIYGSSTLNHEKYAQQRSSLYWKLDAVAKDFDLIVEGIFHQIRSALILSHVKGDRRLLNSSLPMYSPSNEYLTTSLKMGSDYEHLSKYAEYLGSIKNRDGSRWIYPEPVIKSDFVNDCLSKYLLSLRGYQIVPESMKINSMKPKKSYEDEEFYVEYLNVKNSAGKILGFQDVGSGISYLMPILTSLWASNFSIIEQPELHLHPKAQCELGDIFISAYSNGASALIESHSEHLLLRILRRIRESNKNLVLNTELNIAPDQLFIYYFDPQPDGATIVKRIRVDKYGELLDFWPGGFFSERDEELFS